MNRRSFLTGIIAAPAVICTPGLLMPVRKIILPPPIIVEPFAIGDLTFNKDVNDRGPVAWIFTKDGWSPVGAIRGGDADFRYDPKIFTPVPLNPTRDASYVMWATAEPRLIGKFA